jgi:hypothetical protein
MRESFIRYVDMHIQEIRKFSGYRGIQQRYALFFVSSTTEQIDGIKLLTVSLVFVWQVIDDAVSQYLAVDQVCMELPCRVRYAVACLQSHESSFCSAFTQCRKHSEIRLEEFPGRIEESEFVLA